MSFIIFLPGKTGRYKCGAMVPEIPNISRLGWVKWMEHWILNIPFQTRDDFLFFWSPQCIIIIPSQFYLHELENDVIHLILHQAAEHIADKRQLNWLEDCNYDQRLYKVSIPNLNSYIQLNWSLNHLKLRFHIYLTSFPKVVRKQVIKFSWRI